MAWSVSRIGSCGAYEGCTACLGRNTDTGHNYEPFILHAGEGGGGSGVHIVLQSACGRCTRRRASCQCRLRFQRGCGKLASSSTCLSLTLYFNLDEETFLLVYFLRYDEGLGDDDDLVFFLLVAEASTMEEVDRGISAFISQD